MADGQGVEGCGGDKWMRMSFGTRIRASGGYRSHTGGCFMSDEFGIDVPMSDCQGEHVGQYKDVPAFVTRNIETLRDKFALAAITSMILTREFADPVKAYLIADAMLEARKK